MMPTETEGTLIAQIDYSHHASSPIPFTSSIILLAIHSHHSYYHQHFPRLSQGERVREQDPCREARAVREEDPCREARAVREEDR